MPDTIVCTRAIKGGSFSSEPGPTRFLKTHPVTHPVVDPISLGCCFDDPVFLKDLTFTLAGDMDRNVIPTRVTTPTLSLAEK